MKKQKLGKLLVSGVIVGCLLTTGVAFAAEDENVPECKIQLYENGEASPRSMYFRSFSLDVFPLPEKEVMEVNVTTKAFQRVNHIYHDVTIYKNGSWYSSDRYENWGKAQLNSYIKVPAVSGDYIEVYVDHYTEHNGCIESRHSSKTGLF